jgi:hypothetical protein
MSGSRQDCGAGGAAWIGRAGGIIEAAASRATLALNRRRSSRIESRAGGMAERFKAPVLKCGASYIDASSLIPNYPYICGFLARVH